MKELDNICEEISKIHGLVCKPIKLKSAPYGSTITGICNSQFAIGTLKLWQSQVEFRKLQNGHIDPICTVPKPGKYSGFADVVYWPIEDLDIPIDIFRPVRFVSNFIELKAGKCTPQTMEVHKKILSNMIFLSEFIKEKEYLFQVLSELLEREHEKRLVIEQEKFPF